MAGICKKKRLKIKPELNWQDFCSQYVAHMKSTALHAPGRQGRKSETALMGAYFAR